MDVRELLKPLVDNAPSPPPVEHLLRRSRARRRRRVVLASAMSVVILVVAVVAVWRDRSTKPSLVTTASGQSSASETGRTPDGRCLPAPLHVSPATAAPGMTITVSSTGGCSDNSIQGSRYRVSLGFEGREAPVIEGWTVFPSADGAFSTQVEIPANASQGSAHVSVSGSPFDNCSDSGRSDSVVPTGSYTYSCAGYSAPFLIGSFPSSDRSGQQVLGPGSWSGARTSRDGQQLIIVLVGGPEYVSSDACSVAYQADVSESQSEVQIRITGTSPKSPDLNFGCTALGYHRTLVVSLRQPLGSRSLIDEQFNRTQPVFDGSTLADVGELPDRWQQLSEGPGYPDPLSARYWTQSWGEPPPAPKDSACAVSPSPVTLTQGPLDLLAKFPDNGEQSVSTEDVHGQSAAYLLNPIQGIARLQWTENGMGFVLTSSPRCQGDAPASKDVLVQVARSLKIPA